MNEELTCHACGAVQDADGSTQPTDAGVIQTDRRGRSEIATCFACGSSHLAILNDTYD